MNGQRHLLAILCSLCLVLVLPVAAGAAEIVDRNVGSPTLQVDSHNVALVSYTVKGTQRHVLYWGAVDWADTFKRDYSGGWKSKVADYKRFSNSCGHYTGAQLPFMIAACDAPDGSHWALQQWGRLWRNYGGDTAPNELYVSHWRGQPAELAIQTDYSYHGKHQHLWGTLTFHGKPVFGLHHTLAGVPTDKQGRNIYVDYLAGTEWRRASGTVRARPRDRHAEEHDRDPGDLDRDQRLVQERDAPDGRQRGLEQEQDRDRDGAERRQAASDQEPAAGLDGDAEQREPRVLAEPEVPRLAEGDGARRRDRRRDNGATQHR